MRVFLSEDEERKFVHCQGEDDFVASFNYGEWFDRKMVDTTTMKELNEEDDMYEVALILRQARKALRYGW